ncbi:MAG: hypothetical protein A3C56_03205 [Ignavibacteria bacterium RIFCSPHIGHO2_02_FULL_56_12]|nr:MAG: hypothetical protein A3C56_03205 [Ignavibacteria bacterium RIFCSPHIGHO2_02_FULL_56_12]
MRRNFVYFVVVPLFLLLITFYLFLDSWVESGLEYAGETAVGAKVEIDDLHLTLSPIGMSFSRLQVTDPKDGWKNLFETGPVRFALNFGQLLRAKFIIETMEVNGLTIGTKRTTDGSIPPPPEPARPTDTDAAGTEATVAGQATSLAAQASPILKEDEQGSPVFDLGELRKSMNIDSLVDPKNLLSYRLLDSLKLQVNTASARWDTTLTAIDGTQQRLDEISAKAKSINVNDIKNLEQARTAFNTAKEAYDGAQQVSRTFNERKSALTTSVNELSRGITSVDDVAKQDFQNVVALAKLPDVSMKGLGSLVLGKDLLRQAYEYLGYIDLARNKIPQSTSKPDPTQPKRSEGITVHFPVERAYPKLWIQKILISGGTDAKQDPNYFYAKGQVLDITNDQRITGKPLTVALSAMKGLGTSLSFDAVFDRRTDIPHDNYKVDAAGIRVGSMSLGRSNFLPARVTDAIAQAKIEVDVPGNRFTSDTRVDFGGMKMQFEREAKNVVERIVHDVLNSVSGFFVSLRMWKPEGRAFDVAFATDLDDQLSSRTKKVVGDEIARLQNEIRQKLNERIAQKRKEVEGLIQSKRTEVSKRLTEQENRVKEKLAVVEQKKNELEQRVEQEKKKAEDAVKKKAGDVLKGIIKKN